MGLSEKSRLVEFVFCSLYTSSQLRDMTDKSASPPPRCVLLSFPPPLCLLFILPSFHPTLLGLTFVLEMTFQWCELLHNIKPDAATKSQSQSRVLFFLFLHLSSAKSKCTFSTWGFKFKISVVALLNPILKWEFHKSWIIFLLFLFYCGFFWPPPAFTMYWERHKLY